MINSYQNSIIAQLLEAITGQVNFTGAPTSNIGDILLSILEQTPYDKEPKSVLAELFLKLKDKLEGRAFTPYDKEPKSAIAEILLSILNETEYDKEPNSRIAELLLELKAELESYTELTASGAIANFTTSVVKPLVNLTAYFNATQEAGTPTPQSPKAITGVSEVNVIHTGANLFDKATIINNYYINDTNGTQRYNVGDKCTDFIEVKPSTTYFIYSEQTTGRWGAWYDENKNYISNITLYGVRTAPANAKYVRLTVVRQGNGNVDTFSVNYPSSDTEYHAYNGSTTLINLGGTYYGGYVSQDKDGKRELVVTHGVKLFSELDFRRSNSSGSWSSYIFFAQMTDKTIKSPVKCSNYDYVVQTIASMQNETIVSGSSNEYIYVRDDNYTDVPTFKTANANTIVVYDLAEPITIPLTDGEPITAFNGVNNIYNDSGDTSVTYLAKIEDNLNATAKFRAEEKAQKEKAKEEEKEIIKEDPIEEIKEPIKDSGETKKGTNKA